MRGALSFANIILALSDDEVVQIREDDIFDEIVAWLALYRVSAVVEASFTRLVGRVN